MNKILTALAATIFTAATIASFALPARADGSATVGEVDGRKPTIEALVRDWDQYGFVPPVKPAQMSVNGRNGISISGAEYATALSMLRQGTSAMREGRSATSGAGTGHTTNR